MVTRGEVWWVDQHRIPTEVELGPADGLPTACALNLDNVATIPREFFVERITRLGVERMRAVCVALEYATGC